MLIPSGLSYEAKAVELKRLIILGMTTLPCTTNGCGRRKGLEEASSISLMSHWLSEDLCADVGFHKTFLLSS